MGKFSNLISIINLLHSRPVVTGKQISDMCQVTSRTVLRYIRDLSEANVPVYYDREKGGYCLTQVNTQLLDGLAMEELVCILFALRYLGLRMNDVQHEGINALFGKLVARQKFDIDEILGNLSANLSATDSAATLSHRLNSIAIQVAAATQKDVRMTVRNGDSRESVLISKPSLLFQMGWRVCGTRRDEPISIPMDEVESVQVMG